MPTTKIKKTWKGFKSLIFLYFRREEYYEREKRKRTRLHLTFLISILCVALHRLQKGKDADEVFSVFCLYCGINHSLEYKESRKKFDMIAAGLNFLNAVLLMLLHYYKKED